MESKPITPEVAHLFNPELDALTDKILSEQSLTDAAGKQAAAEPLPGPARQAFSVSPDIRVGPYTVRAARDRDIKTLSQLGNCYYQFVMTGDEALVKTGQDAYELCWVMTRPARDVKAFTEKQGLDALRKAADDEFGDLATGDLMQIVAAAARQLALSCSTVVEHKSPETPGDNGEVARGAVPPSGAR